MRYVNWERLILILGPNETKLTHVTLKLLWERDLMSWARDNYVAGTWVRDAVSWKRDLMSWERDNYVVGMRSYVVGTR